MIFCKKNDNSTKKYFGKPFHVVRRLFSNYSEVVLAIGIILYFIYKCYSEGGGSVENPSKDNQEELEVAQALLKEQEKIAQHLVEVNELRLLEEEANRYFGLILIDPCYRRVLKGLKKIYLLIEENFNELIPDFLESSRILNVWEVYCSFTKLLCIFENKNLESICNIVLLGLQQQLYNGLTGKILTALFFDANTGL